MQAYRGPLKELHYDTADKAIAFAQELGKGLTFLDMGGIAFSADQMRQLLSHLPDLTVLKAEKCGLELDGQMEIVKAPTLAQLETLEIGHNPLWLLPFSMFRMPPKLKTLNLRNTEPDEENLRLFVSSDLAKRVETLVLSENLLKDQSLQASAEMALFQKLQTLILRDNNFGDLGIEAIASCPSLPDITPFEFK